MATFGFQGMNIFFQRRNGRFCVGRLYGDTEDWFKDGVPLKVEPTVEIGHTIWKILLLGCRFEPYKGEWKMTIDFSFQDQWSKRNFRTQRSIQDSDGLGISDNRIIVLWSVALFLLYYQTKQTVPKVCESQAQIEYKENEWVKPSDGSVTICFRVESVRDSTPCLSMVLCRTGRNRQSSQ